MEVKGSNKEPHEISVPEVTLSNNELNDEELAQVEEMVAHLISFQTPEVKEPEYSEIKNNPDEGEVVCPTWVHPDPVGCLESQTCDVFPEYPSMGDTIGGIDSVHQETTSLVPEIDDVLRAVKKVNYAHLRPVELIKVPVTFSHNSDNQCWTALVDSGGDINLLREDVVTMLGLKIVPCTGALKSFGTKEGAILGMVTLVPVLHGRQFKATRFLVVPERELTETVVLGNEFLEHNGILVDNAKNCLSTVNPVDGSRWDYYVSDEGSCRQMYYGLRVTASESVKLTKGESTLVPISIDYPEGHLSVQCSSCLDKDRSVYFYDSHDMSVGLDAKVAGISGLMSGEKHSVLVKSESPAWIKKGEILGKMYSVYVVDTPEDELKESDSSPDSSIIQAISNISLADDLLPEQEEEFRNMLLRHFPVISRGDDDVGECSSTPIKIHLYDETPIFQRPRRFSPPISEAIEQQCQELHSLDIIEPSISPWSSPVVPVIKPDKSIRLCVDYRKLNKVTIADRFPMANLAESVFGLHGVKYFTCLDLVRGYYQLPLHENSKKFTAFSTPYGHWQFKRLSFGLKNAPAVFQREMQRILDEFPKCKVIVYIDDILILGNSFEEHLRLVDRVLALLRKYGLKIKLTKCSWAQVEVKFLGHMVGRSGLKKHPDYIQKIKDFKPPTTVYELRRFLGFVNFQRKFVPMCSAIAKPLSCHTGGRKSQGKKKIPWTEEMNTAFEKLKEVLQEEIMLAYPDYSPDARPLELYVDASGVGAGACLCQEQDGNRVIIAFDSMTFLDCETRYATIERELAALRWGVKTFRSFLYGQFFYIFTDHRPLVYLEDMKMVDDRLSRTLEDLSQFDYVIWYCPGELNTAADWLSRLPCLSPQELNFDQSYLKLPVGLKVLKEMKGGPDSLIDTLLCNLEQLYEEQNKDLSSLPCGMRLRELIVEQFMKDSTKLGFKLDKNARKRIRSMKYPGCFPALELLLAFSKCFDVQVWLHYGPTCPVVYNHPDVKDGLVVHVQCLGGVHFNPVVALKNYVVPNKVYSGAKVVTKLPESAAIGSTLKCDELDEGHEPDVPEILFTAEVENRPQLRCNHVNHPSRCHVWLNGLVFCALIDIGAQVSVVSESVVSELNLTNSVETYDENELIGITGDVNINLGAISLAVNFTSGFKLPEFPYAVVSNENIDLCFIVGRNILAAAGIVVDHAHRRLLVENEIIASFIDTSRVSSDSFVISSKVEFNVTVLTVVCPSMELYNHSLISVDHLREIQGNHRQLQNIIRMIKSGIDHKNLPHNLKAFKRFWSDFVLCNDLLFKRDKDKIVGVVTFNCLVSLVMNTHLQQCHIGIFKLHTMLKKYVWHQSLMKVVRDVCKTCSICQMCKVSCQVVIPPTLRITTSGPFELVAMDLISLPTTSTGFVGCLMVVDHFSKWVIAFPIRNKKSQTICNVLERNILPNIPRIPIRILTDNGPEFTSEEFSLTLERYNIVHVRSTPYKASSNGAVERVNRTIGELLRVLNRDPRKWDESVPSVLLTYNHSVHSEIGCTPAECILKRSHNIDSVPVLSAETRNPWADGHPRYQPFKIDTLVLRKVKLMGNLTVNKLVPRFDGPYKVMKVNINQVTYELLRLNDGVMVKAHHIQLKAWCEPPQYLKRHNLFYGSQALNPVNDVDVMESGTDPTSDSDPLEEDSSSESGIFPIDISNVQRYLEKRRNISHKSMLRTELVRQEPNSLPKSILKPSRTYERKKVLRLFEDLPEVIDSSPVLSPTIVNQLSVPVAEIERASVSSGDSGFEIKNIQHVLAEADVVVSEDSSESEVSVSTMSSDFSRVPVSSLNNSHLQLGLDWDVSPIRSDVSMVDEDSDDDLFPSEGSTNPFRNHDGSWKSREQVQEEVSQFEHESGISFEQIPVQLGNDVIGGQIVDPSVSFEFSGFSDNTFLVGIQRTCRMLTDMVISLRGASCGNVTPATVRRISVSPVLQDIQEVRRNVETNRRLSRDRLLERNRNLSSSEPSGRSPPLTRSRGRPVPLPFVQPKILERGLRKK